MVVRDFGRIELRYQEMRQQNTEGRDIRDKRRREQMENNELSRMEFATKAIDLMRGPDRLKARAEETRRRQEYEIQLRHLFPLPDTEIEFLTNFDESTALRVEDQKIRAAASNSKGKGKGKEPADPNPNSLAPPMTILGDLDAILQVESSASTEGPACASGRPSPPSSTSSPPSLTAKGNPRSRRPKTAKTYQVVPLASERYKVRAIPFYFLVDRFRPDLATPASNLRRVTELGVLHLASGGIMKGDASYHKDCCPNWPMPTTSKT